MDELYTIGEVSEITGLSKDTLRFYDKIGLLTPGYINPDNHYRYYTFEQFWIIDIIICYRKFNIPLDSIKKILQSKENASVVDVLKEYQKVALSFRDYFQKVVDDISWYERQHQKIKQAGGVRRRL